MKRAVLALALCAACSRPPVPAPVIAAAAPAPGGPWRFEVTAGPGARELAVDAVIHAAAGELLSFDEGSSFVSGLSISAGGPFVPLAAQPGSGDPTYRLPACPPEGCRLRYRFALAQAAMRRDNIRCAQMMNGAVVTSPSVWLAHPVDADEGRRFTLRVSTAPGTSFIAGLLPVEDPAALPPALYEADLSDLPNPAWGAFGALRLLRAEVPGEVVDIAVLPGALDASDEDLRAWITSAAGAVRSYYGRASIRRALVVVKPDAGRGTIFARTLGNGGASIVANVGEHSTRADLVGGWAMIHELFHVSFPNMQQDQSWMEEGMATYVEPLLRARLGMVTPEEAFGGLHRRMPLGQPTRGEGGLDGTRSWGRTYWGGAMFYLLADVAIRERTSGARSLDDALRAVLAAGGNVAQRWDVDHLLDVADGATGVPVFHELYARLALRAETVDLDALWRRLGVVSKGDGVSFDETAELAPLRRAMVTRANMPVP